MDTDGHGNFSLQKLNKIVENYSKFSELLLFKTIGVNYMSIIVNSSAHQVRLCERFLSHD